MSCIWWTVGELPSGIAAVLADGVTGDWRITHRQIIRQFGKRLENNVFMIYIYFEIVNCRWSDRNGNGNLPAQSFYIEPVKNRHCEVGSCVCGN